MKTKIVLLATLLTTLGINAQKKWTLKECVDYALKNNITIKQNKLNVDQAKLDVKIAEGNFLPDLNASSSGTFNSGLSPDGTGVLQNTQNFSSNFQFASQGLIFNGFKNINNKEQSLLQVKGSEFDLAVIENDVSLNVVNTYLNVLFAKENLSVAQTQSEISKKQIERAKAQFEAGAIPKGDLLNVESTAANDIQNVIIQENTLNIALLRLSQLLQISNENFDVAVIDVNSPSAVLLYDNAKQVYDKALTNRPEISKAKLDVKNAEIGVELAKGDYLPTLSYSLGLSSSYFHRFTNILQANDFFFSQIQDRIQYSVGLSLNIPIFNRFQTKNRVAKSRINKKAFELALENQKLELEQTIEQAFLDAKAAAKTFEAAQISLAAQKEAFKNAQTSYEYGSMTQFDFDQVRNRLVNSQGAMIRAKYDYIFKTKVLKFYFGESIID